MRVNANAVLCSWMLLAAFGSSYAPAEIHKTAILDCIMLHNYQLFGAVLCKWYQSNLITFAPNYISNLIGTAKHIP